MFTPVMLIQLGGAVFLLALGAWVIVQGVTLISEFYPRTLVFPAQTRRKAAAQQAQPAYNLLTSLDQLISSEISALNLGAPAGAYFAENEAGAEKLSGAGDPPADADILPVNGSLPVDEEPAAPPAESAPQSGKPPATTNRVEAIARMIEAVPSILNANFGPAAMLCFIGLVLCAGGFYLILNLGG